MQKGVFLMGCPLRLVPRTTGFVIDLSREAPDVVTEARFRSLLAEGFDAEVFCKADAYCKASVWYGEWIMWATRSDDPRKKVLVTVPRSAEVPGEIKFRVFKTINGLVSFLERMGFEDLHIPLKEGGQATHSLPKG
jgi:hypothetical protein